MFAAIGPGRYRATSAATSSNVDGASARMSARIGPPSKEETENKGAEEKSALSQLPELKIPLPTLVIWGEKDTALLPGNLNGLDQVVPTLTVRRIPDGTHWVVRENAPEVNRLIREFIGQR